MRVLIVSCDRHSHIRINGEQEFQGGQKAFLDALRRSLERFS